MHRVLWTSALAAAVVAGYLTGSLHGLAALWVAIAGALAWSFAHAHSRVARVTLAVVFALYAIAMGFALLPGFDRVVLVGQLVLSPGAAPYDIAVGFPKVVTGIFVLGFISPSLISRHGIGAALGKAVPVFAATALVVMIAVFAMGYTAWAPKWTNLFLLWAPINLFFTCLSEEALFRGFLQYQLARIGTRSRSAQLAALAFAATLFGLAHIGGGVNYAIAATLAGLGYGWAFQRTQRIEASVAVHFGVNAVHFLVFVYPTFATV